MASPRSCAPRPTPPPNPTHHLPRYLDEPSTGLDPASRRKLWGVISAAKANKAVLLTTHSMEEAEVLCDRIGIMSEGIMKCLDIPSRLKARYGEGYKLSIHTRDRSKDMSDKVRACGDVKFNVLVSVFPGRV